jgi:hypothetical protein
LEAAEAKRQLREISLDDIKGDLPFGVMDVLLEANCYNNLYAGSLPKWGPNGGVHVVLKVGEKVIQPLEKWAGKSDSVSILPQEHGVVSRQGSTVTYTPLYRSALYERAAERAWFTFSALPADVKSYSQSAKSCPRLLWGEERVKSSCSPAATRRSLTPGHNINPVFC